MPLAIRYFEKSFALCKTYKSIEKRQRGSDKLRRRKDGLGMLASFFKTSQVMSPPLNVNVSYLPCEKLGKLDEDCSENVLVQFSLLS